MNFEFNPFRLLIPPGGEPIRSITVTSNIDWFDIPDPVTGQNAFMAISAKTDILELKVFGSPAGGGTPSMLSLVPGHIPQLEISKINGLQAALNALVKTITSANPTALAITNNGVGDYLVTPNFGQIANKFAQGNDNRFPASVTGLRKGAGVGANDTAAVARTDFWDTSVFVASGIGHAKGLVPDPGSSAGTIKFLCEDGTWKTAGAGSVSSVGLALPSSVFSISGSPVTSTGTLTGAFLSQTANTFFLAPVTGASSVPAFRPVDYRDVQVIVGTAASTIAAGNDNRFPANVIGLRKSSGTGATDIAAVLFTDYWDNTVFVSKGPSHKIGLVPDPGAGTSPYNRFLRDDASWQPLPTSVVTVVITSSSTYTTPVGVKSLLVEAIGGGGGGGGAPGGAGLAASSGGAGGGYARAAVSSPASSYAITIGAGGAGGAAGANDGSDGNPTAVGSIALATGGEGGHFMTNGSTPAFTDAENVPGGVGSITDTGAAGSYGGNGIRLSATVGQSGYGGAPPYLGSSIAGRSIAGSDGHSANLYGSGGAGALALAADKAGGDGSHGIVIITEYR